MAETKKRTELNAPSAKIPDTHKHNAVPKGTALFVYNMIEPEPC